MRVLYISQNGMAENLGQAQVLPYLRGLARRGVDVDLVSFELATLGAEAREALEAELARDGLRWHSLTRTLGTPLRTKVIEAGRGVLKAFTSAGRHRPDIVHGRSYFATAIAETIAIATRSKLLFDCRGMIADEFVDCGYWDEKRVEYRLVKAYEKRLFRNADGLVVLTRALASWLRANEKLGPRPLVEVIPCCVDLAKFTPSSTAARAELRAELALGDRFTILYSGSLGTWYLEPEMAAFAAAVRDRLAARGAETTVLCLTGSDSSSLVRRLRVAGFEEHEVVVRRVPPSDMPRYLSVGDVGLSFIQSCFSKKGSSPTKVAEYLACGNIAVVNGDIGDQADLAVETDACVVLQDFSPPHVEAAAREAIRLAQRPRAERIASTTRVARQHFALEEIGVPRYASLYERLVRSA